MRESRVPASSEAMCLSEEFDSIARRRSGSPSVASQEPQRGASIAYRRGPGKPAGIEGERQDKAVPNQNRIGTWSGAQTGNHLE